MVNLTALIRLTGFQWQTYSLSFEHLPSMWYETLLFVLEGAKVITPYSKSALYLQVWLSQTPL